MLALIAGPGRAAGRAVDLAARPFAAFAIGHPQRSRFGALTFVGGFEITSTAREVGGLSGLLIGAGGASLLAISDDGVMVKARLVRDAAGRPVGLADGAIRRMQLKDGRPLVGKANADCEAIDVLVGSRPPQAAISFEGLARVFVGSLEADGFVGPLSPLALPADTRRLTRSKGLEALASLPPSSGLDGRMVILGEEAESGAVNGDQPGWVIGGRRPVRFRVRADGYALTDAKVGPDGRLYVLERLFSLSAGLRARIRRFALGDLREGARVDGEILFEASLAEEIDNMEGLALWVDAGGRTRLSLISDDNHSFLQRTVYLEFSLER